MKSPLSLCESLDLTPTSHQHEVIASLMAAVDGSMIRFKDDDRFETARAVGIYTIWRVLSITNSAAVVVAQDEKLASDFMTFINAVTQRRNPTLASVSGFPRWNLLQFGGRTGWEIRIIGNNSELVARKAPEAVVSVVLGAGCSDVEALNAASALRLRSTHARNVFVEVW